jgi:hypothetical protein
MESLAVENYVPQSLQPNKVHLQNIGVNHRTSNKIRPNGGVTSNYTPEGQKQIIIEFSLSDGIDLASTALQFDFTAHVGGVDSSLCNINDAKDVIQRFEWWMDNTLLIENSTQNNSMLNNIIYRMEGNLEHASLERDVLMGYNDQNIGTRTAPSAEINRKYLVPLAFLHPCFASHQIMPVLGSRVRLVLFLEEPDQVLSIRAANASYRLDNVFLITEEIIYTPEYSAYLKNEIRNGGGFEYNYVDFHEVLLPKTGGTNESLVIRNKFNNALSLYLYEKPPLATYSGGNANTYPQTTSPLAPKTTKLNVRCGGRNFTFSGEGATSLIDLYLLFEKCSQSFSSLSANGLHNFASYSDPKGFSPLCVSLERFNMEDTEYSIINRGLSSVDQNSGLDILVELELTAGLNANSKLFGALVYEKMMRWDATGIHVIS